MSGFQAEIGVIQQEAGFGFDGRFYTESYADNIAAFNGGGQTNATPLTSI